MRFLLAFVLLAAIGCSGPITLPEGIWSGELIPMNHPDMKTPIEFRVSYPSGALEISMLGSGGGLIPFENLQFENRILSYSFMEPEGNIFLMCSLSYRDEGILEGRCADDSGKWGLFRLRPPSG